MTHAEEMWATEEMRQNDCHPFCAVQQCHRHCRLNRTNIRLRIVSFIVADYSPCNVCCRFCWSFENIRSIFWCTKYQRLKTQRTNTPLSISNALHCLCCVIVKWREIMSLNLNEIRFELRSRKIARRISFSLSLSLLLTQSLSPFDVPALCNIVLRALNEPSSKENRSLEFIYLYY